MIANAAPFQFTWQLAGSANRLSGALADALLEFRLEDSFASVHETSGHLSHFPLQAINDFDDSTRCPMQDESCMSMSHFLVGVAPVRLLGSFHGDSVSYCELCRSSALLTVSSSK